MDNKIAKNYMLNVAYQLFVLIVPIVTAPYLARTLGAESQGIYSYVNSVSALICTFSLLGIYNFGNRQVAYVRDDKAKLTQTFYEMMFARLILGTIGTIVFVIVSLLQKAYTKYFISYYPWLLACFIDCSWVFVGVEDMKPAVVKNFFNKLISLIGIFIFVKSPGDVGKYILLMALSVLVGNALVYTQLKQYIGRYKKCRITLPHVIQSIKGSAILFLPFMATTVYDQIDKIMIKYFLGGTSQVAFYDDAEKIVDIPLTFILVLSTVMMPRIANEFKKENFTNIRQYLYKAGEFSFFLAFPLGVGLICVAKQFVPWYLGNSYLPTAGAIIILAPIVISNSIDGIIGKQLLVAANCVRELTISYFIPLLINIIINIILIPQWGLYGAALATLICNFICIIIQYVFVRKKVSFAPLKKIAAKYFTFAMIMGFTVYAISLRLPAKWTTTLFQAIVGILVYVALCAISKDQLFFAIIKRVKTLTHK